MDVTKPFNVLSLKEFKQQYHLTYELTLDEMKKKKLNLVRFVEALERQDLTVVAAGRHQEETLVCFELNRKANGIEASNCEFLKIDDLYLIIRRGVYFIIF